MNFEISINIESRTERDFDVFIFSAMAAAAHF